MDIKCIKNVRILRFDEYKVDLDESLDHLMKFENLIGSIPIGDGSSNEMVSFNIFSTLMSLENIEYKEGWLYGDLYVIDKRFEFINNLDDETIHKMFYDNERSINFKPIIKNDTVRCFNIDNKLTNIDKMRESIVVENDLGLIKDGDIQMKLNICFKIPKGFKGDLNDAILELYKYRTSKKTHTSIFEPSSEKDVYDNWWDMVSSTDRRLHGEVSLTELKDGEWKSIE